MTTWDDVVSDITTIDVDQEVLLATPLGELADAPWVSGELFAAIDALQGALHVETLGALLERDDVAAALHESVQRYARRAFLEDFPEAVRRLAMQQLASSPGPARREGSSAVDGAAFDPREVPLGGEALDRWARYFGIDLGLLSVNLRIGNRYVSHRVAELADLARFPNLGANLGMGRKALRAVAVEALRERAFRAGPLVERREAFAARRTEPETPALRAHLTALRAALAQLPADRPGPDDDLRYRYPDRRVKFCSRPPSLEIESEVGHRAASVDLDAPRVRLWFAGSMPAPSDTRAALACAIDALCDPVGEARRALERWSATPRWRHALDELDERLQDRATTPTPRVERLAFRVVPGSETLPRAVLQSPRRGGGFTSGRVAKPSEARRLVQMDRLEEEILDLLEALADGGRRSFTRPLFSRLVDLLARHPRVFVEGDATVPVRLSRVRPRLVSAASDGSFRLELWLGEHRVPDEGARAGQLIGLAPPGSGLFLCAVLDEVSEAVLDTVGAQGATLPAEGIDALFRAMRAHEGVQLDLELPSELRGQEVRPDPRTVVRLALRAGATLDATLRVRHWVGGPLLTPGQGPAVVHGVQADGGRTFSARDLPGEVARAEAVLAALGASAEVGIDFTFGIDDPDRACDAIVALADLGEEVEVEWEGQSLLVAQTGTPGALRLRIEKRRDWFGIEGGIDVGGEQVSLAALLEAVRARRRFVRLKRGRLLAIGRELRERLVSADDLLVADHGELVVGAHGVERLTELVDDEAQLDAAKEWTALRERWREARTFEPAPPEGILTELRPYQAAGFAWLSRLAACGVAGCLADDMGLGKTVQALALMVARAGEGPTLVVAPTSVGGNWEAEAARFAPGLRVWAYRGPGRAERLVGLGPGDVLVTSYDLMVRDVEALAGTRFATLVFDEAHAMKNAMSKRAMVARRLDADFRLALTGTPVENHLGELWSLFRVLMPALFGSWERFRKRFAAPIERDRDPERQAILAAMVRPYLLRRTKDEVAPELPARTEVVRMVELSVEERDLYEAERVASLESLAKMKKDGDARFAVFSALLRLRQLACHPRLRVPDSQIPSSKLESALELLEELREAGHRALVFSQFTSHLALVRAALESRGFSIVELDGSTPAEARADRVEKFQAGAADVFLISLKAGGVGLNLTAANYVLHLDPWWNPAAEDQASDRAHRIGQTRPVTVVRLIARDTIEETVLAMHAEKRELALAVLEGGEASAKLSTGDLVALMERADGAAPVQE